MENCICFLQIIFESFPKSDEVHSCHVSHNLGSEVHLQKSQSSVVFYNAKNFYRGKENAPSYPNNRNVPPHNDPEDVSIDSYTTVPAPNDGEECSNEDQSTNNNVAEAVVVDIQVPAAPSTSNSGTISLTDHLLQSGLEIRDQYVQTESGNCWCVHIFSFIHTYLC